MNTYIQKGKSINYFNATTNKISAGDIVIIGKFVGIAGSDIPPEALGAVIIDGVFSIDKDAIAINQGDIVYYNDTTKKATTTKGTHILGVATITTKANETFTEVKLLTALA